ncbi:hypothetical protein ABFV83_10935 [Lacrimispora sp. BS-2]|uniref:Uncharacterized protein n=1 Tax=Lacrimispora sp. BS-2 TaxID=3151850 RepID=A0AAU7PJ37_9FIRM
MEKEKVINLLCERVLVDENDPVINRIWDEMTVLLSQNSNETINFLNDCTEEQIFYISEIIEDISHNLKSQDFINTLYELNTKFPNLQMEWDIEIAKEFMEE